MAVTSSPAAVAAPSAAEPFEALAPLRLPADLRLTPEQFALVCAENREAVLELAADGRIIAMTPTGSETGARNSRLVMRLLLWADKVGDGRCSAVPEEEPGLCSPGLGSRMAALFSEAGFEAPIPEWRGVESVPALYEP